MDGREPTPSDYTSRLANLQPTTEAVQSTPFTLCIVCSGSQEFKSQPTQSSDITDPCWNPSGSTVWKTDDVTARDVNKYCVPNNGLCKTSTWQYATKNALTVTSYWVGIQRGCQDNVDGSTTGRGPYEGPRSFIRSRLQDALETKRITADHQDRRARSVDL